jgi:hypothetical protein
MWFAIHIYMEAMLAISLYSYFYPKLTKPLCVSYYLLCSLFNKIGEQRGQHRFFLEVGGGGGGPNKVYT